MELKWEAEFENQYKLEEIKEYLAERDHEQAFDQVDKLQEKLDSFKLVLNCRFVENELSYSRYHSVAEQTFYSAIYNLNEVVIKLKAIDSIDIDYIDKQLTVCGDDDERESLLSRKDIHHGALQSIKSHLKNNEKAMTELDKFSYMLSNSNVDNFDADDELTLAITKISKLTETQDDEINT